VYFRCKETKLCDEEFGELCTYLVDYMSVLWNIHVSLVDYKRIKDDLRYVEQLETRESLRWEVYQQGNEAVSAHIKKVLADNGIKSSGNIRDELLEKSKEINERYDSVNLLQERYFNLRVKIHNSIDKLERQAEGIK